MKKLIIILLIILTFNAQGYAQNIVNDYKEIAFVYINGANNNTPYMKKWFYKGIAKFHPIVRKAILNSDFMQQYLLENSTYSIAFAPEIFFWGDKSYLEISSLHEDLTFTEIFSPRLAQMFRKFFAYCMHDAIWIQKEHNMYMIVKDLHKMVMDNYNNQRPVVLFGYSAGSFITYEYLFHKMPYLEPSDLFDNIEAGSEILAYVEQNKAKKTCIDAIINSKLAVLTDDGKFVSTQNFDNFKQKYDNLDSYTCQYCMPKGAVKGIVNYASPIPLFYSDLANPNYSVTYYTKLLYQNIISENMFWLTVNYADDPLGFPTTRNLTPSEFEQILNTKLTGNGFVYDKSDVKSPKTFIGAHTSYWDTSKKFSKAVVDAYKEGYTYFNIVDKLIQN